MYPAPPKVAVCLLLALCASGSRTAQAQTNAIPDHNWGTWHIATVILPAGPKHWGGYAEAQTRANGLLRQYFYTELKGGVSYDVAKNFTLMLAGGRYSTADYRDLSDGPLNVEKRLWQQLTFTHLAARLKMEHRYRVEQRWFNFRDDVVPAGSFRYRNRLRYRFNAFLPLNHPTVADKTAFLSVYDEVFFNPRGPFFERNRVYAGMGYQFDQHWTIQAGWVNQANYTAASYRQNIFTPQTTATKNNVVLSVMYRISRGNAAGPTPEHIPSQPD
ncbi:DUF2490 domain-containing protein [Hymenobacter swuensis]|uniref:DUF2490 domain-containing protein n=1 Tax=Hymenobacter swuensis DY53 TaxID=1227739 RepID=W8F3V4_9BACT|nr:DUF2490 domain-containing protein [Hymenobacter swuensis]AHJ99653.1 hypothetical protein Hsw_4058 [Hymenobacter swuensis DY53]